MPTFFKISIYKLLLTVGKIHWKLLQHGEKFPHFEIQLAVGSIPIPTKPFPNPTARGIIGYPSTVLAAE